MVFGNVGVKPIARQHSDKEILDLIEDFLVNHFGEDERTTIADGEAIEMLQQIENFVELRRNGELTQPEAKV